MKTEKRLWFDKRNKLNKEYKKWIKENNIYDDSFNVITFLEIKNLFCYKNY